MTASKDDVCQRGREPVVRSDGTIEIPLSRPGMVALVDPDHYHLVKDRIWYVRGKPPQFYASARIAPKIDQPRIHMHRVVAGAPDGMVADHINHDSLDNRACNLRVATYAQNSVNKRPFGGLESGLKGARKLRHMNAYQARIRVNGRERHLGVFKTAEEAARAYDEAARWFFGEFACTNESVGLLPANKQ